jgi:hypothetical protein
MMRQLHRRVGWIGTGVDTTCANDGQNKHRIVDLLSVSCVRDIGEREYIIERVDGDAIAWFDSPGA